MLQCSPNRRVKSIFLEGLFTTASTPVRIHLDTHTSADYQPVAQYAQELTNTSRSACRQIACTSIRDGLYSKSAVKKAMPRDQVLSVDTLVVNASLGTYDGREDVLLMETGSAFTTTTNSSPPTSYFPFYTQLPARPPRQTRPESTTDRSSISYARWSAPSAAAIHCRL